MLPLGRGWIRDLVAEAAQSLEVVFDGTLHGLWVDGFTKLDEACSFMENVPNDFAQPVGHGPDRFHVSETDDEALKNQLKMAALVRTADCAA